MGLWKKLTSRHREDEGRSASPESPGMTYADLERDKDVKERQLSGAGFEPPSGKRDDSAEEEEGTPAV